MRKILLVTLMLVSAVLAVSCGQKAEQAADDGTFVYASFAIAEKAATAEGKYMVLDFYTDW